MIKALDVKMLNAFGEPKNSLWQARTHYSFLELSLALLFLICGRHALLFFFVHSLAFFSFFKYLN